MRRLVWATCLVMAGNLLLALATVTVIPISDGHDHRLPYERWAWIAFGIVAAVQLGVAIALAIRGKRGLAIFAIVEALACIGLSALVATVGNTT
jgi:hypothetical protein